MSPAVLCPGARQPGEPVFEARCGGGGREVVFCAGLCGPGYRFRARSRQGFGGVCAGCHARLHRLAALRPGTELLVLLWTERRPGVPVQLQFPAAA